jgi:xylulokinase
MPGDELFLGLDLGTSGSKLIAFDAQGNERRRATRAYSTSSANADWLELNARDVWQSVTECFREIDALHLGGHVRTLSISAQGEAIMPLDHDGSILAPSPVSADMRARPQVETLAQNIGYERYYAITGQPLSPLPSLPKLMWWRQNRPDLTARTYKYICYGELALVRLGLPPIIDESMAARVGCYDIAARQWSSEILAAAQLPRDSLPEVRPSGSIVGTIKGSICEALNLPPGIVVILGGHDQPMAALGAGITEPGACLYSIGTTESIVAVVDAPNATLGRQHIACYPHVAPSRSICLAGSQSGGRVLGWYRDVLTRRENGGEISAEALLSGLVDEAPSGPIFLAHLVGSGSVVNDPESLGAFYGLSLETTSTDLLRSVLEGITFEQAWCVSALESAGLKVGSFRAVGGGASSSAWLQMKADILGAPIEHVATRDASCLGAAILGLCAVGRYASVRKATAAIVRTVQVHRPRPARHALHIERLALYRELYGALRPLSKHFRNIRRLSLPNSI